MKSRPRKKPASERASPNGRLALRDGVPELGQSDDGPAIGAISSASSMRATKFGSHPALEDLWVISVPADSASMDVLTAAEQDVAQLVIAGASNAEVAATRGTSVRTVANQLRSIYTKLGIVSRTELAALVWRLP